MAVPAVAGKIVGTIIVDGVKYLLKKTVDSVGSAIWQAFADEDENGVPDTPDNPFNEWTEEPDEWTPFPPAETSEPTQTIGDIVLFTPDGPVILYSESGGEEYDALVSQATELWVEKYGAMDKPLHNYSVSEALLFIIAAGTVVSLFCKLFKRRKL